MITHSPTLRPTALAGEVIIPPRSWRRKWSTRRTFFVAFSTSAVLWIPLVILALALAGRA